MGPWGNGSKDLHNLVRTMAECRVEARGRMRGREGSEHELGLIMGQVRRSLSIDFVRAQSLCLLSRLCNLGPGARAAAGRRQEASRGEEARRREQVAHFLAHIRGRGVGRAGEIFTRP